MVAKRLLLLTILGLVLALPGTAKAATKPNGITLSPFQKEIAISPSDTEQDFDVTLTNNTANIQELTLATRDFGSLNDSGGVLLEGSKDTYAQKYGLTSWLGLGTDTVVLNPGEQRAVPVSIQNRLSLQPGGHYGAVVASVTSLDDQKNNRVVINQQLLSLLFVKKTGGEHYDIALDHIANNGNWIHLPTTVTLRFQNPGNVHVVPRGIVRLKSPSGKVLSTGVINTESAYILPETYRELIVPLTKTADAVPLPGPYKIEVAYRYDGISQTVTKSSILQFVSLPTYAVIAVVIGLVVYGLRRYKRRQKTVTE